MLGVLSRHLDARVICSSGVLLSSDHDPIRAKNEIVVICMTFEDQEKVVSQCRLQFTVG